MAAMQSTRAPFKLGGVVVGLDHTHPRLAVHESHGAPHIGETDLMKPVVVDGMIPSVEHFKIR